jgi:hypothetical protein
VVRSGTTRTTDGVGSVTSDGFRTPDRRSSKKGRERVTGPLRLEAERRVGVNLVQNRICGPSSSATDTRSSRVSHHNRPSNDDCREALSDRANGSDWIPSPWSDHRSGGHSVRGVRYDRRPLLRTAGTGDRATVPGGGDDSPVARSREFGASGPRFRGAPRDDREAERLRTVARRGEMFNPGHSNNPMSERMATATPVVTNPIPKLMIPSTLASADR